MKLKKFKSFNIVKLGKENWAYHLSYVDFDDVIISFIKQGFSSKKEAQNFGEDQRMERNNLISISNFPENGK